MNMMDTSSTRENCGQRLKSAVLYPVVLMIDATWKAAVRSVSSTPP